MLCEPFSSLRKLTKRFRRKPPKAVMHYNVDVWLKILSYVDPETVRSFSRTCTWAKSLVECYSKRLPLISISFKISVTPEGRTRCMVNEYGTPPKVLSEFGLVDEDSEALLNKKEMYVNPKFQLWKYRFAHVASARLHCVIKDATAVPKCATEIFKEIGTEHYRCSIIFAEEPTMIFTSGRWPASIQYGLRLAESLKSIRFTDGPLGKLPDLLFSIFTVKWCTELQLASILHCNVLTLTEFLKKFLGVPTTKAHVQVHFLIPAGFNQFADALGAFIRVYGLADRYRTTNCGNPFGSTAGMWIRSVHGDNCFWFKRTPAFPIAGIDGPFTSVCLTNRL